MRRKYWIPVAVLGLLLPGMAAAQFDGHELTDRLIERAEASVRQIALTRWQVMQTVAARNALIEATSDSRTAHGKLKKQVDKTEKQVDKTRRTVDRMESAAKEYFDDWAASLEKINDEETRANAFGRMSGTRDRYDEILALGRKARDEFDTFISLLKDKLVFTGHDLNPDSLAALREDSDRFNERAESLRREIDRTIGTAHRYIDSLRPE